MPLFTSGAGFLILPERGAGRRRSTPSAPATTKLDLRRCARPARRRLRPGRGWRAPQRGAGRGRPDRRAQPDDLAACSAAATGRASDERGDAARAPDATSPTCSRTTASCSRRYLRGALTGRRRRVRRGRRTAASPAARARAGSRRRRRSPCRRWRSAGTTTSSSTRRRSSTAWPIADVLIIAGACAGRTSSSTSSASRSICSAVTGRPFAAAATPAMILRAVERLADAVATSPTTSGTSSRRSYVVKRWRHCGHGAAPADRRALVGLARVDHLGVVGGAASGSAWRAHYSHAYASAVQGRRSCWPAWIDAAAVERRRARRRTRRCRRRGASRSAIAHSVSPGWTTYVPSPMQARHGSPRRRRSGGRVTPAVGQTVRDRDADRGRERDGETHEDAEATAHEGGVRRGAAPTDAMERGEVVRDVRLGPCVRRDGERRSPNGRSHV